MGDTGPKDHSHDKYRRIPIAFPCKKELSPRASSRQTKGESRQDHAAEVPETHRVRHRLFVETRVKLSQDEVGQESKDYQGDETGKEVGLPEQDKVPDRSHGAEPASLRQEPDDEADC